MTELVKTWTNIETFKHCAICHIILDKAVIIYEQKLKVDRHILNLAIFRYQCVLIYEYACEPYLIYLDFFTFHKVSPY